jgi:hypothetical protein
MAAKSRRMLWVRHTSADSPYYDVADRWQFRCMDNGERLGATSFDDKPSFRKPQLRETLLLSLKEYRLDFRRPGPGTLTIQAGVNRI